MQRSIPTILALIVFWAVLLPELTFAQSQSGSSQFGNFEFPLPGITGSIDEFVGTPSPLPGSSPDLAPLKTYVGAALKFAVGVIVLLGLIVTIIGGYLYMTAAGSAERVSEGKKWIGAALLGIALALTAYTLLNTISAQFVGG